MGISEPSDEKEVGATIQCKKSWVSSFYGANFMYLRHNRPCVFGTPLPYPILPKKTYCIPCIFHGKGILIEQRAFFLILLFDI